MKNTQDKNATVKYVDINWKPDKSLKIPLYSQIVSYFSEKIEKGDWITGQYIPPQRKLAQMFEVNRSTVWEAMQELSALGLTEGNYGKGTMIVNDTWEMLISNSSLNWHSYIDKGSFYANLDHVQKINQLEYQKDIIRLGTGEISSDLIPAKELSSLMSKIPAKDLALSYPHPLGLLELREALCSYLEKEKGIITDPSCIMITSGALQALQLISVCIVPPHSSAYIESPSYIKSLNVFQSAGTVLEGIPMDSAGIMPWIISKNLEIGKTILYTIPTLQNPTGKIMTAERRDEVLRYCRANRIPIIEDDVLGDLWYDERPPKPIKAHDSKGSVIYVGSCSKTLSPGLRVGWIVGPESVIQRIADIKMQMDYGTSTLSQQAFTHCLNSGLYEKHLLKLRKELKKRRDFTLDILNEYYSDLAVWDKPEGSYYVWLKLKGNISTKKIFETALKENLLINPGEMYDFAENRCIRISYAYETTDKLKDGLIRLADIIKSM